MAAQIEKKKKRKKLKKKKAFEFLTKTEKANAKPRKIRKPE